MSEFCLFALKVRTCRKTQRKALTGLAGLTGLRKEKKVHSANEDGGRRTDVGCRMSEDGDKGLETAILRALGSFEVVGLATPRGEAVFLTGQTLPK